MSNKKSATTTMRPPQHRTVVGGSTVSRMGICACILDVPNDLQFNFLVFFLFYGENGSFLFFYNRKELIIESTFSS
jgi:hypothetical protein